MKNFFKFNALLLFVMVFLLPKAAAAKTNAMASLSGANAVTISIGLDSIGDIDGCNPQTCQYWQMIFEKQEVHDTTTYHRYYSSDVFPASQLSATYVFNLPAGEYSNFTIEGYNTNKTGNCGWEDYSNVCPDGKHIMADTLGGSKSISDPSFLTFIFVVNDGPAALPTLDVIDSGATDSPAAAAPATPAPAVPADASGALDVIDNGTATAITPTPVSPAPAAPASPAPAAPTPPPLDIIDNGAAGTSGTASASSSSTAPTAAAPASPAPVVQSVDSGGTTLIAI